MLFKAIRLIFFFIASKVVAFRSVCKWKKLILREKHLLLSVRNGQDLCCPRVLVSAGSRNSVQCPSLRSSFALWAAETCVPSFLFEPSTFCGRK